MSLKSLSREESLGLLSSMGVNLPRKTKLPDAELEKRVTKTLDCCQYVSRILPLNTPFDPTQYTSWKVNRANKPVLNSVRRHNVAEAGINYQAKQDGVDDPFPLYQNALTDLRQSMMSLGNSYDNNYTSLVLEDAEQSSGIKMQILDVVEFDKETPILMVLYTHDLASKGPSRGSRTWMQNLMDTQTAMPKITATLNEQHLLLRLLKSNSKRLSSSYSPSRTALDRHMTLSFLPPVGPLESKDIARLNTNDGCSICGDPAKSKCSRCAAIRYCGPVCQKEDWRSHKKLCSSLQGATWQNVAFRTTAQIAKRSGVFAFQLNRFDMVQHGMGKVQSVPTEADLAPPANTHGPAPFIVKVQLSSPRAQGPAYPVLQAAQQLSDESALLIYDKRKSFEVHVMKDVEVLNEFVKIADVVRAKGHRGLKVFMWAVRTGDSTVQLCLDQFPEWQPW